MYLLHIAEALFGVRIGAAAHYATQYGVSRAGGLQCCIEHSSVIVYIVGCGLERERRALLVANIYQLQIAHAFGKYDIVGREGRMDNVLALNVVEGVDKLMT